MCGRTFIELIVRNSLTKSAASEALVSAECDGARAIGNALDHIEGRQPFGISRDAVQRGSDNQPERFFSSPWPDKAQLPPSPALVVEPPPGWVVLRYVLVGALPAPKIGGAVHRKMLARQQSLGRGWASTTGRNLTAISPASSRSRFFEKVE
jgi:hypothetical protein